MKKRIILHYDMDAFYAAVEIRDNPSLKGKPVIVGADPNCRGVVTTCSYEARKYGVRSGMPISKAYRLCPLGEFIKPNMRKYCDISEDIQETMLQFTDTFEFIALDEGFLDITHTYKIFGSPEKIALTIKENIKKKHRITCSVGIGYNKMTAKLASEEKKPDGFFIIDSPKTFDKLFLNRPADIIYGLGPSSSKTLYMKGIETVQDLRRCSMDYLQSIFGVFGGDLYLRARGIDNREVTPSFDEKSFGHQISYQEDTMDIDFLKGSFIDIIKKLSFKLKKKGKWFKTLTISIRYNDMQRITRAHTLPKPSNDSLDMMNAAFKLLEGERINKPVGQVGLRVSRLTGKPFPHVTFDMMDDVVRRKKMDKLVMDIRQKYGEDVIVDPVENYRKGGVPKQSVRGKGFRFNSRDGKLERDGD